MSVSLLSCADGEWSRPVRTNLPFETRRIEGGKFIFYYFVVGEYVQEISIMLGIVFAGRGLPWKGLEREVVENMGQKGRYGEESLEPGFLLLLNGCIRLLHFRVSIARDIL